MRRIRVEMPAGNSIMGFYHLATEDMSTPSKDVGGLRMIVTGDSWTNNTGTADGIRGFPYTAGLLCGIQDTWQAGIGGTGYLQDSTQGNHLGARLSSDIYPNNPDILLLCFGSDDTAYTTAQVATEAEKDWNAIMGNLPDCLLIVMGPYACPAAGGNPNYANAAPYNTALKNAAADCGVHFIDPIGGSWITGTGYVGATNGTGTSDTLTGTDGVHPSQAGHDFMARRTAKEIQAILATL
jgi:lysophospholipase L1-like esterase